MSDHESTEPGTGSGRGGALGAPSLTLDDAPPSEAARHSPSSQAPSDERGDRD